MRPLKILPKQVPLSLHRQTEKQGLHPHIKKIPPIHPFVRREDWGDFPCSDFLRIRIRGFANGIYPGQHIAGVVGFAVGLIPNQSVIYGTAVRILKLQRQSHGNA